jgi:hypothetical protein
MNPWQTARDTTRKRVIHLAREGVPSIYTIPATG